MPLTCVGLPCASAWAAEGVTSWAEPLRSAAQRGRRGRLGFSSKLQTAWLRLRARDEALSAAPSAGYVPRGRDEAVSVAAHARLAAAAAGRREAGPLTAVDSWACTTVVVDRRASRARLVVHVMPRRARARCRARALSRPRARACTCLHCLHHLEIE